MINVIAGQSIIDIAIQEQRNPLFAFELAFGNGISITDELSSDIPLKKLVTKSLDFDFSNIAMPVIEPVIEITAISNQSIIDIAIQESGTPFSSIEWLLKNGINITDLIAPGTVLKDPEPSEVNIEIKNYFKSRGLKVATYYNKDINTDYLEYILPGEFPYSF